MQGGIPEPVVVTKEEYDALVDKGDFLVHHSDLHVHPLVQQHHGVTTADAAAVLDGGKLCLMTGEAEEAEEMKAKGVDCLAIFFMPPSLDVFEERLDKWLSYSDESVTATIQQAGKDLEHVEASKVFDNVVVNDDIRDTLDELKDVISKHRPDILPPQSETPDEGYKASLFVCCPSPATAQHLHDRISAAFPGKFARPWLHTTRTPEKGEKGGAHFVKREALEQLRDNGKLLYALQNSGGWDEGVAWDSVGDVWSEGATPFVVCPLSGVQAVRERRLAGALCIFVAPSDPQALGEELLDAMGLSEEDIQERVSQALRDTEDAKRPKLFDSLLVADDPDVLFADVRDAIAARFPNIASPSHLPLIIGGPFGIGKRQLLQRLFDQYCREFVTPVVTTTRAQREIGAQEDAFVTEDREAMERNVQNGKYLFHHEGYDPEEALQIFYDSAKLEVEAAEGSDVFQFHIPNRPNTEASYCRLAEAISSFYPGVLPASNVWGFGRPLWDKSCRVHGHRPLRIIVVGPATVGKTTLCQRLRDHFGVPHISAGELLYKEVQERTPIGLEAKKYMDASETVPDHIFLEVVTCRLRKPDCDNKGWLLDGFPHTQSQAMGLKQQGFLPDKVIFLESEHALLLNRAKHRRVDAATGQVYQVRAWVPKQRVCKPNYVYKPLIALRISEDLPFNISSGLSRFAALRNPKQKAF
ncbi:unnamed protein product [Ostreobium quekettii]|uniref:adenylate kinase n=1 Tax=Ostreobium quekettii TaxID=121088 RepID=A0A8S1J4F2_9CHLO|nr:unnamed protein product [Ostreobium quekettii]